MTATTTPFDTATLQRAYADRDADALLTLYADDAEIELADANNPPSRPARLKGRDAVRASMADVFGRRDLTHEVDFVALGPDALGYRVRCAYGDGTRVLLLATAELRDGRIVREVAVQAWD